MISSNEYAPYFLPYIQSLLKVDKSIVYHLNDAQTAFNSFVSSIPLDKENYKYEEGKWTVKEVIQHIIDTERVFCYRALSFARNELKNLPGFDQDEFVAAADLTNKNLANLIQEMDIVRQSTLFLFESFTVEDLKKMGTASGKKMSVRAAGMIIAGHQLHHLKILKERYL